ncbi:MAG: hypothetical protein RL154_521 [Pseudomonadota bacterium]|jgi:two-component system LytT family response regulator
MKILIVDDEYLALTRLSRLLNELEQKDITKASSANEALKLCEDIVFDVAFLDINLPDKNGLELAIAILKQFPNIVIVFQTAYESHALKAYSIGAIDYLLKPYSKEQVLIACERASKLLQKNSISFIIKTEKEYEVVDSNDIYYIEADLTRTIFRTKNNFLYYNSKISDVEEKLKSLNFFRIHRSYLINIAKIKSIHTIEQSKLEFYFTYINDSIESSKDGAKLFRIDHINILIK